MIASLDNRLVKAAILGLVVGDALGVPVEFMSRTQLTRDPVTGMRAGGTHAQPAGTWSDDSSMTLCTLESLTHGLDYQDIMRKFLSWQQEGKWTAHGEVFDIGITTKVALMHSMQGWEAHMCGESGFYDNGNGSLMRILPVALYLFRTMGLHYNTLDKAYQVVHDISSLTHAHPISQIACGIYCSIADELLCGHGGEAGIREGIQKAKDFYQTQTIFCEILPMFHRVDTEILLYTALEDIDSSGYVLNTLEAALWCLLHTKDYPSCVLAAVNLGDDTDTVAAVVGGLAGIEYGISDIPDAWLSCIARRQEIEALCTAFSNTHLDH